MIFFSKTKVQNGRIFIGFEAILEKFYEVVFYHENLQITKHFPLPLQYVQTDRRTDKVNYILALLLKRCIKKYLEIFEN